MSTVDATIKYYKTEIEHYLSGYNHFLKLYQERFNQIFLDNYTSYHNKLEKFSSDYRHLLLEESSSNQIEAWRFCVFNIIKLKRIEESLHSPLIKELLDTNGSHGQKDVFYQIFIKQFLSEVVANTFINIIHRDYLIKCEEFIQNESNTGRIDIIIKSTNPEKKFAIIIENKWESGDSCSDQLFKYYHHYTKVLGYNNENLLIFYLTKSGNDPSWIENIEFEKFIEERKGINYFPISYNSEICLWLKHCIEQCKSKKVQFIIEQYLTYIKWHQ